MRSQDSKILPLMHNPHPHTYKLQLSLPTTLNYNLSLSTTPYTTVTPSATKFVTALAPCIRPNLPFNLCISLECGPGS